MSTPKPEAEEQEPSAEDAAELSDVEESIAALRMASDVDGLLALAKQYRSGTGGVPRDMHACLLAYVAAADLGSAVAQHAAGLFYLNGGVVARDEREAALKFRAAADQGHLPAKVLVANLYELGIHYRADAAKADVWYRNVARSAEIDAEPGTAEYAKALADLGSVRYCLEIAQATDTPEAERARLLKVARTYGYRPPGDAGRVSELPRASQIPEPTPSVATPVSAMSDATTTAKANDLTKKATAAISAADVNPSKEPTPKKASATVAPKNPLKKANVGLGATAFLFSLVFAAVGLVLGHVLRNLGIERVAAGETLPVVGQNVEIILPLFAGVLAVLPNLLVYRFAAFLKAALVGAAAGIAAEVLWGMSNQFLETRAMQVTDFATSGLLVGLLVFGLFGGAKPGSR